MGTDTHKRKIAVILAADVEGYSRLMGADEEATAASDEGRRLGFDHAPTRVQTLPYARDEDRERVRQALLNLAPADKAGADAGEGGPT